MAGMRRTLWTVLGMGIAGFTLVAFARPSGLATEASSACEAIRGLQELQRPGSVLLLGEMHGTVESPRFVLNVACLAASADIPIIVGLELAVADQQLVDSFLESSGSEQDRQALMATSHWQRDYQDGRNSQAMFELIDGLRQLRSAGNLVGIVFFDSQPGGGQARERAMAERLAGAVLGAPEAMVVVLTGNMHSRIEFGNRFDANYEPMGYLLAKKISDHDLMSLNVSYSGGQAWVCAPECGVIDLGSRGPSATPVNEIQLGSAGGHLGTYGVGRITASPPARTHARAGLAAARHRESLPAQHPQEAAPALSL